MTLTRFLIAWALPLVFAAGFAVPALAEEEGYPLDRFPTEKMRDMASLQHGAKLFVNYCLNCHSASYMRYNRLREIGLTEDQIQKNLVFAGDKVGDAMKVSLDPRQAKEWLAAAPPDLTLITRSRSELGRGSGADYVYTYLRTFYRDDTKATGWNNATFPDVAMPNVLWKLQGQQVARFVDEKDEHDEHKVVHRFAGFERTTPGTLDEHSFDESVADLVAYLQWMGEPAQSHRTAIGVWALLFLGVLTLCTWRLNASYWKNVN